MTVYRSLEGYAHYTELGLTFTTCYGVPFEKGKVAEMISELVKTLANENYDQYREEAQREYEESFGIEYQKMKEKKKPKPSILYFMECGGRYKIGISKDVERRVKELDRRPFNVNVIATSEMFEDALKAERILHSNLKIYRLGGEWFDLPDTMVDNLTYTVENAHNLEWNESYICD